MCFTAPSQGGGSIFQALTRRIAAQQPSPADAPADGTPVGGTLLADLIRRQRLGAVTSEFSQRVREAGLGTSVTPKPLGTVVRTAAKDITRQS